MLLSLHVLAIIRARKVFKRESKAELSPTVQGTVKCLSIPHCRAAGIYRVCILKTWLGDEVQRKGTKLI